MTVDNGNLSIIKTHNDPVNGLPVRSTIADSVQYTVPISSFEGSGPHTFDWNTGSIIMKVL